MSLNLSDPIEKLSYIGPKNLPRLKKLGIKTIKNLLWHFPVRHDDYSKIIPVASVKANEPAMIQGEVVNVQNARIWKRRLHITTAIIKDDTDTIRAVWFNQPFIANQLKEGALVNIAGKISLDKKGVYFSSPTYEKYRTGNYTMTHTGGLIPKYPETDGITSKYLRFLIKQALGKLNRLQDPIPDAILEKYSFPKINTALRQAHFPSDQESMRQAKDRLAFEELLFFQLRALRTRRSITRLKALKINFDKIVVKSFVESLPFELTTDQKIAAFEILKDLERTFPMNRLLNGDVGSGKTIVALIAAYQAAKTGYQVAFMAPTEILAQQHFQTVKNIVKDSEIRTELLIGSSKNKKEATKKIAGGFVDIIIGTHALIQKNVRFKNLGLVIIDEQHRFGVEQRAALLKSQKSETQNIENSQQVIPHLLSMTATPIPRTLALTIYGDLDISLIKEKPKGRQKIITKVISPVEKGGAYKFIDEEIEKGRQVFLICPRIELADPTESANTKSKQSKMNILWQEVKAVKAEYEKISKEIFPRRRVAMLHGKLKPAEKEKIMKDFKDKKCDILVSTSVIEVGVDIPNATIMAIENAERFGLAQLHQFRGRVGRGEHQSHCLLFCGTKENLENKRLKTLVNCDDGFELAESDLRQRGPGQFLGNQQSGIPDLAMASLTNLDLIKKARLEAKLLLKKDPSLKSFPLLRNQLLAFHKFRHFE